jgi:uncharacterized protein
MVLGRSSARSASHTSISHPSKKTIERAREVEVNRRGALELYLGCVPIVRSATTDSLGFGGEGEIVEWAVHYASF